MESKKSGELFFSKSVVRWVRFFDFGQEAIRFLALLSNLLRKNSRPDAERDGAKPQVALFRL